MDMKKFNIIVILSVILLFFVSCDETESVPTVTIYYKSVYMPENWFASEGPNCPCGHMCRHDMWVPSMEIGQSVIEKRGIWVFGVTGWDTNDTVLHFRKYPQSECISHCFGCTPVQYSADVIYVPWYGGEKPQYSPDDVPLTYIPPGKYVVTSPSPVYCNTKIWYFADDGTGAQKMSAALTADRVKYDKNDNTVVLRLQITDVDTEEYIKADSVFGDIVLPDGTQKTLGKETWQKDWLWNDTEKWYEYVWDFKNDLNECSDPREGFYEAYIYVKKQYYQDIQVKTEFGVCYHVKIDLEFDKDIPEYSIAEPVEMTVYVTDEKGAPVTMGIESVLIQPDGTKGENLLWTQQNPGIYVTSFEPTQDGTHSITVGVKEDVICYLEEAFGEFYVNPCEKAFIDLDITGKAVDEEVILQLKITDADGNLLSGGIIESDVWLLNYPPVSLSWTEIKEGIYEAVYVPSEFGSYSVEGTVIVFGEETCFEGSFQDGFIIEEKNLPDLIIRNEDIVISPKPHPGETVIISVTVLNWGNADAENFTVVVLMNDTLFYEKTIAHLAKGDSITLEIEWTIWYSGSYIIQAIADPPEGII